jgi:sulfur-oxidizing protein SoxX
MRRGCDVMAAAMLCCVLVGMPACSAQSLAVPGGSPVHASPAHASDAMPAPLVDVAANADIGREVFGERESGNCVLCHRITGLDVPFQGDVGPDLTAVGARLSPAQLRFRIVDASRLNPATVMPAYFRTDGLSHVAEAWRGRTVLTGEQVEHLVAYLSSLDGEPLQETGQ